MGKRDIAALVESKVVRGWDDPRLYTLVGLRRRGIPPGAVLSFINELGATTSRTFIQTARFEQSVRKYLETTVPRLMLVLDPVRLVVVGEPTAAACFAECCIPFSTKDPDWGGYIQPLTRTIYIDRADFRETAGEDYFRLAPGKTVGLFQAPFPVKAVSYTRCDTTGLVTEVRGVFDKEGPKPKSYIHWVPEGSQRVEARVYAPLFKSDNPRSAEGGLENDIRPDSEAIYPTALVSAGFDEVRKTGPWPKVGGAGGEDKAAPESARFQAVRVGYFVSGCWAHLNRLTASRCRAFLITTLTIALRRPWTVTPPQNMWCSTASCL